MLGHHRSCTGDRRDPRKHGKPDAPRYRPDHDQPLLAMMPRRTSRASINICLTGLRAWTNSSCSPSGPLQYMIAQPFDGPWVALLVLASMGAAWRSCSVVTAMTRL